MVFLLVDWILGSLALLLVSSVYPGFRVTDLQSAVLATAVVGLISAFIALVLTQITAPARIAISAVILFGVYIGLFRTVALLVPGFAMLGFAPAVAGALVLIALHLVVLRFLRNREAPVEVKPLTQSSHPDAVGLTRGSVHNPRGTATAR
jgi:putative membrane protein